jgi:hypothetical protein
MLPPLSERNRPMRTTASSLSLTGLLLAILAAGNAAFAVPADVCEQQRALYPKDWNDVLKAKPLFRCQSHYEGTLLVSIGPPDEKGRSIMNLVPIEPEGDIKLKLDDEHQVHRMWLDVDQTRRLQEGRYFATVVRTQESCWIRGDMSGDPVFFMDNADAQPDIADASAFYNTAPRISAFKGAHYTCEAVK